MAVASMVSREQFKTRSDLEFVHLPTGAVFHAYPYTDPNDRLQSMKVNWGREGAPTDIEFREQIRRAAGQLLLEQARRTIARRRLRFR